MRELYAFYQHFQRNLHSVLIPLLLITAFGWSIVTLPLAYAGRQPTIPVYPGSLEAAVEAATRAQASVSADATFSIQVINQVGGWVFGTSGVMPAADDDMPNLLLFLAEERTNGWAVAIEYTDFFRTALASVPRNLLTAEQWTTLSTPSSVSLQGDGSLQLALPWAVGETQYLTGGPHAPGRSTVWGALDFAGGSGIVRAARSGIAYTRCSGTANDYVRIDHGGGLSTHYYHLANVRVTNGQWAGLWTELGRQSTSVRCLLGSATGAHVHFWVTLNGQVVDIHGKDIGGWTVSRGSAQYQGCMTQVHNPQVQRCTPGNNAIKNEGWIGSGYAIGQGSDRIPVFGEAYSRNGGAASVGYPTEPVMWRGTTNRVTAQYFDGGSYGPSVLIHDRNNDPDHLRGAPAYLLHGRILHHYHLMGAWDSWLGPPTSDEFINKDGKIQQNFRYGFLIWHGGDNIEEGRWPAPLDGEWYVEYRNYVHDVWNFLMGPTWVENRFSSSCWGMEAPGSGPNERRWGVWSDYFNVRWSGRFYFEDGIYRFRARADDLIRIWFDGTRIIDDSDPTRDLGEYTADVRVNAGYHQVVVEYVEMPAIACAEFSWTKITSAVGEGSDRVSVFQQAYNRHGGAHVLGYPTGPVTWRGSTNRVLVQEFNHGILGPLVMVHDRPNDEQFRGAPAYIIRGDIWQYYNSLGAWDSWLGPPTSDEFTNADEKPQQNFRNGMLIWHGPGNIEARRWPARQDGQWYIEYRNYVNNEVWNFQMGPTWVENRLSSTCWGDNAPGSGPNAMRWGVWPDYFTVRWSGRFYFEEGLYRFRARADDSIYVRVDWDTNWEQSLVITDLDYSRVNEEYTTERWMSEGYHTVLIEFIETWGQACTEFSWTRLTPLSPSNLRQTGSTQDSVTIAWQDNADNENGFYIYRLDGSTWRRVATVGANVTSYTFRSLNCGSSLTYRVSAYNSSGESPPSANLTARSGVCSTPISGRKVFIPIIVR